MQIILQGIQNVEELKDSLSAALKVLSDKYKIPACREVYINLTLVDSLGCDVELFDTKTAEVFRTMKVRECNKTSIRLAVDNTKL